MAKRRDKLKPCYYCGVSTVEKGEHFYLKSSVWNIIHNSERGFVCLDCRERIIGRLLNKNDFTDCSINKPQRGKLMNSKLYDRINREK